MSISTPTVLFAPAATSIETYQDWLASLPVINGMTIAQSRPWLGALGKDAFQQSQRLLNFPASPHTVLVDVMRHLPIEQCELFLGEQRKVTLASFVLGWNKASLGDVAIERCDLEETA